MRASLALLAATALVATAPGADAQVRLDGYFIALEACTTGRSIRASDDIGQPETRIRHAYDIIGKNTDDHTHFQIRMPEVSGARDRWVAAGCGVHVTLATAAVDRAAPVRDDPPTGEDLE
ncbi:MAG: hypothetical protein AAFV86_04730, partial [Pseudomonadota bacterium]